MREIKFRAWDDKDKKWLLGYELQNLGGFSMFGEVMAFGEWTRLLSSYNLDDWKYIKIMQFTGLLDKNGKEIYEGDICKTYTIGEPSELLDTVVFDDGSFVFQCDYKLSIELRGFKQDYIEIIGNIYENPELLK